MIMTTPRQASPSLMRHNNLRSNKQSPMKILVWCLCFLALNALFQRAWQELNPGEKDQDLVTLVTRTVGVDSTEPFDDTTTNTAHDPAGGAALTTTTTSLPPTPAPTPQPHRRYHEMLDEIKAIVDKYPKERPFQRQNSYSAYSRAHVVKQAPWLPHRRMCKETCCVSPVAISLDQDKTQLINTQDGVDLSDTAILHYNREASEHLRYHAQVLHPKMVPCLLPGTIIEIENHKGTLEYFWKEIRPHMQQPYVLLTSGSDDNSPGLGNEFMGKDPLLIRWLGTNPLLNKDPRVDHKGKFKPLPLGFSYQHPQEKYLLPYMQLNNFTHPFRNKEQWLNLVFDGKDKNFNWETDVFVHFGLRRPHRKYLWPILCPNKTADADNGGNNVPRPTPTGRRSSSCHQETEKLPVEQIYADMSQFKFGISPTGMGWDCYRTYELLVMGVIPVIDERDPESHALFEGLPVIHMPNMNQATSQQEFIDVIKSYITSDAFLNANFDEGWERLFLHYRRRELLRETGRDREILKDDQGREYYQAYHYEYFPRESRQVDYCSTKGKCAFSPGPIDLSFLEKAPVLSKADNEFLGWWKRKGQQVY